MGIVEAEDVRHGTSFATLELLARGLGRSLRDLDYRTCRAPWRPPGGFEEERLSVCHPPFAHGEVIVVTGDTSRKS
jgi:hypothetical protein